jgi:hypothetical protein
MRHLLGPLVSATLGLVLITLITFGARVLAGPHAVGHGVQGIAQIVPAGDYDVQIWSPPSAIEPVYLYVLTAKGMTRPLIFEPYYVSDLGLRSRDAISIEIQRQYGTSIEGTMVSEPLVSRDGAVVGYLVHNRDLDVNAQAGWRGRYTLYLSSAVAAQGGGGGGGAGGGGGGM